VGQAGLRGGTGRLLLGGASEAANSKTNSGCEVSLRCNARVALGVGGCKYNWCCNDVLHVTGPDSGGCCQLRQEGKDLKQAPPSGACHSSVGLAVTPVTLLHIVVPDLQP
jgi:hypothetical protein